MSVTSVDIFRTFWDGSGKRELVDAVLDEVTWPLNGYGSAKISFNPLSPDAALVLLNEIELQVWMNDHLVHYVVPRTLSGDTTRVTFDCEGILSWWQYAYITEVINNFSVDQIDLAVEIIEWVQEQVNGDRNVNFGLYSPSGVYRSRPTSADDWPNAWDLLTEFPKLDNGFDFGLQYSDDGRREFWPYYPHKGIRKPKYALELDQRGRRFIKDLTNFKVDGLNMATEIYTTGGTVTDTAPDPDVQVKIVGHYEDLTTLGSPKYGRMTQIISEGQIIDVGWLNDRAKAEEKLKGQPVVTADPVVSEELFGKISEGDVLPMRVDYGVVRMMGDYRIMSITWRNSSKDLLLSMQPA